MLDEQQRVFMEAMLEGRRKMKLPIADEIYICMKHYPYQKYSHFVTFVNILRKVILSLVVSVLVC